VKRWTVDTDGDMWWATGPRDASSRFTPDDLMGIVGPAELATAFSALVEAIRPSHDCL